MINVVMFLLGSTVDIFSDEGNTFTGILFQDSVMKSLFASYPEVLMIDATYKLNELRMPLYLMIVLDSNGQSEIVAGSEKTVIGLPSRKKRKTRVMSFLTKSAQQKEEGWYI